MRLSGENLRRKGMVVGMPRVGQGLGEVSLGQAVPVPDGRNDGFGLVAVTRCGRIGA